MITKRVHTMLEYLRKLVRDEKTHGEADRELVKRFVSSGDETAFAALMRRHSGLVWSICRRLLHHEQDAEDAFQATFLVLAKKAGSIRTTESVGSWLYGVARRIALKARAHAAKRRQRERFVAASPVESPSIGDWELRAILDEELHRLPEKYRVPFVLCCLEGKRRSDAARELRWNEGTLSTRLATAKRMLRARLSRRGLALAAALEAVLHEGTLTAAVPAALERTTRQALLGNATGDALGIAPQSIVLATGVLKTMLGTKLKTIALACVLLIAVAGVGAMARQVPGDSRNGEEPSASPSGVRQAVVAPAADRRANTQGAETLGTEKSVGKILAEFEIADAKWKARVVALTKLVKIGSAATPALIDALKNRSPETRALIVEALTVFRDPRAKPAFRSALQDPSPDVRINAIRGLSILGRLKPTEEPYRSILEKDPSTSVRRALAWAFERDDAKTATALVRNHLSGYDVSKIDTARLDDPAPDFSLIDAFGKTYRLSDFRGRKAVVLKFYNEPL